MKNLHSIAQRPAPSGIDWSRFYADPVRFAEHVEGRFFDTRTYTDTITADDIRAAYVQMRDAQPYQQQWRRTRQDHELAVDVMRRIDRAAMALRYAYREPPPGLVFEVTPREWNALRMEFRDYAEFERNFGPEGAQPTFRGLPLRIAPDYGDPLRRYG